MKKWMIIIVALVLVFTLFTACTAPTSKEQSEGTALSSAPVDGNSSIESEVSEVPANEIKLALILNSLNGSFYAKIGEGAKALGEMPGVTVDVMGPSTPNSLQDQVNMIESCIGAGYNGIATVVWDPKGFNNVIEKAHAAGIPVIAIAQESPESGRDAFIGQDLEASGYALGKYMFEKVMNGQGKYIIASCGPAETALVLRINGIKRAAEEFPGIEFIDVIDITTDLTKAVGVIENAYLANPDVTAILGTDVFAEAIGTFIASNNLKDKVKAGGFDLTEGTLKHIRNGDMQVTIGQNPFLQGYYAMSGLYLSAKYGYAPINVSTGVMIVDSSNVDVVEPE